MLCAIKVSIYDRSGLLRTFHGVITIAIQQEQHLRCNERRYMTTVDFII